MLLSEEEAVLLAVSLSWAVAVDVTPAENRPYVGSSKTNSVIELALGYNGIQRITGRETAGITVDNRIQRRSPEMDGGGPGGAGENGSKSVLRLFNNQLSGHCCQWLSWDV